jgi:3-isopropylmalate dehydratase small subunit
MQPFTTLTGVAVAMIEDDINTDQMAPIQLMRGLEPDYGDLLFKRQRLNPDGTLNPAHVLNRPQFASPAIVLTGENFGCGSSREAAVWCLVGKGIRCVIARSIADIFKDNCLKNGVLAIELSGDVMDRLQADVISCDGKSTFTVDLHQECIVPPDGKIIPFEVAPADRLRLLEGLDEIGLTLKEADAIARWEEATAQVHPWLQVLNPPS